MNDIIWQLTQWRGELTWGIFAGMAYVAIRCAWAAKAHEGASRRLLLFCAAGIAVLTPIIIHPGLGIMPLLAAVGLCVVATSAARKNPGPRRALMVTGLALLLGTSGMVSAGQVLNLSSGPSMWPTSPKGFSFLWIDRGSEPLRRGQQVEVHVPLAEAAPDPDTGWPAGRYHKRVVGLPGDQVRIDDYQISVNGTVVADCGHPTPAQALPQYHLWLCNGVFPSTLTDAHPVHYQTVWGDPEIWMNGRQAWTVPQGQALVLGDNLVESADSRQRGLIPLQWIISQVRSP